MGNLFTGTLGKVLTEGVGNVLTGTLGNVLTELLGKVLDIYNNQGWATYDPLEYDSKKWEALDDEDWSEAWANLGNKYRDGFVYKFPLASIINGEKVVIDPNGKITLIAISPGGKETRFEFDLSKMR